MESQARRPEDPQTKLDILNEGIKIKVKGLNNNQSFVFRINDRIRQ